MSTALATEAPAAAALSPRETWAVYRSPHGAPAPYLVIRWRATPGERAVCDEPIYAASLELARGVVPAGLVKSPPRKLVNGDRLVEIWTAPRKPKERK